MDLFDWMQDKRYAHERRILAVAAAVIVLFATVYTVLIFTRPPDLVDAAPSLRVPPSAPEPEAPTAAQETQGAARLIATGQLKEAGQLLDEQEATLHRLRGTIAWKENDLRTARERFELAVQLAPRSAVDLGNLAMVQLKQGEVTSAITLLRQARALAPTDNFLENLLLLARLQAGETEQVNRELSGALQIAPESSMPSIAMAAAAVCLREERISDAVQFLNAAKSTLPPDQFAALLAQEPLAAFADHPAIAAYYRKAP